jgi:hypothetical protein
LHNRIGRTDQAWRAVLNFVARVSVAFGGEPIIARRYIVTKKFTVNEGEKDECDIFMHRSFTVFNVTHYERSLLAAAGGRIDCLTGGRRMERPGTNVVFAELYATFWTTP